MVNIKDVECKLKVSGIVDDEYGLDNQIDKEILAMYSDYYNPDKIILSFNACDNIFDCKEDDYGDDLKDLSLEKNQNDTYSLFLETIYVFENKKDEFEYYTRLHSKILMWMVSKDYKLDKIFDIAECDDFKDNENWYFEGNSIEDVVTQFHIQYCRYVYSLLTGKDY